MTGFKVGRLGFIGRGIARRLGNTVIRHGHLISQQLLSRRSIFHHHRLLLCADMSRSGERPSSPVSPDPNIRVSHTGPISLAKTTDTLTRACDESSPIRDPNDAESGRPPSHRPHFRDMSPDLHFAVDATAGVTGRAACTHSMHFKLDQGCSGGRERHVLSWRLSLRRSPPSIESRECAHHRDGEFSRQ